MHPLCGHHCQGRPSPHNWNQTVLIICQELLSSSGSRNVSNSNSNWIPCVHKSSPKAYPSAISAWWGLIKIKTATSQEIKISRLKHQNKTKHRNAYNTNGMEQSKRTMGVDDVEEEENTPSSVPKALVWETITPIKELDVQTLNLFSHSHALHYVNS